MHVLSKLFVALVALLTAALVPMVVTYAYNEDSYKAKWQESRAEIAALQGRLDAQSGEFDAVKTGLSTRAAELEASLRAARSNAADSKATVERLRDDLSSNLSAVEAEARRRWTAQ